MKESKPPNKLNYKNDTLPLSFNFYSKGLVIEFTNKLKEDIKIKWDEIRMTENEIEKKIEHISFRSFRDGNNVLFQLPSIISPESGDFDFVVYADNIYYQKKSGEQIMQIKDMYPRTVNKNKRDSIQKLIGQKISLFFPFEIRNVSYSWNFYFLLTDIKSKKAVSAADVLLFPFGIYLW